jgi:tripartite-type tricarboxylate transporter receptor subunit TctC
MPRTSLQPDPRVGPAIADVGQDQADDVEHRANEHHRTHDREILRADDMKSALKKLGSDPLGGASQDFKALLAEEGPKWVEVVQAAGLKVE